MKSLTLDSLRRLISRNRKKDKHESSFKRSESFKRISIKKNYLERGGKGRNASKFAAKGAGAAVAGATVLDDDRGGGAACGSGEPKAGGRSRSPAVEAEAQIIDYGEWIRCIQEEIKLEAAAAPQPPAGRCGWSSPRSTSSLGAGGCYADCAKAGADRLSSSASSISSPPPVHPRRRVAKKRFPMVGGLKESSETLADDGGASSKTDSAISVSLGRIWMDAPLTMTNAPRSLELPKQVSVVELHPSGQRAHHSLESALKERKEEQLPPACASFFAKHGGAGGSPGAFYRGLSSSRDSGFSFSISIPRLSPVMSTPAHGEHGGGLFRKKKPKAGAAAPSKRATETPAPTAPRRRSPSNGGDCRRRNAGGRHHRGRKESSAASMYQVVVNRPARSTEALKLDPIIFVPPEKRKSTMKRAYEVQEIRDYCTPCDVRAAPDAEPSDDSADELYEVITEERCAEEEDDEGGAEAGAETGRPVAYARRRRLESDGWSSETADSEGAEAAETRWLAGCSSPAQHANYSPYLKRRPVVRKKSTHRNVRYVAKPIHRAPSTLKRNRKLLVKKSAGMLGRVFLVGRRMRVDTVWKSGIGNCTDYKT